MPPQATPGSPLSSCTREDAETNARTLERALRFFAELGLDPPEAVMTDNAMVYRNSHRFQQVLASTGAHHVRTAPARF